MEKLLYQILQSIGLCGQFSEMETTYGRKGRQKLLSSVHFFSWMTEECQESERVFYPEIFIARRPRSRKL